MSFQIFLKNRLLLITIQIAIIIYNNKHVVSPQCFQPSMKFHVHIANKLPKNSNPLTVHCESKDDDLGYETLLVNQEMKWDFCDDPKHNTIFQCLFWWDKAIAAFHVFDETKEMKRNCNNKIGGQGKRTCYWEAREDGFYLATLQGFKLLQDWT